MYQREREEEEKDRETERDRKREREVNWFGEERANMHFSMHNNNNSK